ncbi:MAG: extensin family protein [Pseudomonadota bacterium]
MLFLTAGQSFAQTIPVPEPNPNSVKVERTEDASAEPEPEKKRIYQSACPAVLNGTVVAKLLPPISENQCGERSPLEVTGIAGVKLSSKAVMNCRMATTLAEWMHDANSAAENILETKLSSIVSSTGYQCRRRNNAPDGKISEHGFANALDIIGFTFENGSTVTLLDDWPLSEETEDENSSEGQPAPETTPEFRFLKKVRDQACERFTTVLGPESDTFHTDHFHFDLGCHGKTCTYRICQ